MEPTILRMALKSHPRYGALEPCLVSRTPSDLLSRTQPDKEGTDILIIFVDSELGTSTDELEFEIPNTVRELRLEWSEDQEELTFWLSAGGKSYYHSPAVPA